MHTKSSKFVKLQIPHRKDLDHAIFSPDDQELAITGEIHTADQAFIFVKNIF